jgi:FtsH-binding integral membrane protein
MVGCSNYVGKTMAHLAGGLAVAAATSKIPAAETVVEALGGGPAARIGLFIGYLVALFGLIFALRMVPVGGPAQYALALAFVFLMGQTVKPLLDRLDQKDELARVLTLTTGVFVGMMALAYFGPVRFLGLGGFLFAGLVGLILGEIVWMVLQATDVVTGKTAAVGDKVFSWLGVGLFTLYTAYDTQRIKENAKRCRGRGDYINESLGLFLDFTNLFVNLADLVDSD